MGMYITSRCILETLRYPTSKSQGSYYEDDATISTHCPMVLEPHRRCPLNLIRSIHSHPWLLESSAKPLAPPSRWFFPNARPLPHDDEAGYRPSPPQTSHPFCLSEIRSYTYPPVYVRRILCGPMPLFHISRGVHASFHPLHAHGLVLAARRPFPIPRACYRQPVPRW